VTRAGFKISRQLPRPSHRQLLQQNRPLADVQFDAIKVRFWGQNRLGFLQRKCLPLAVMSSL
jgi:hypothetical protein